MMMPRRNLLRYASHAVPTQVRVILEIPRIHVVSARTSGTATVSRAADGNGMLGTDRVPVYRRFRWHFHSFVFQCKTFLADFLRIVENRNDLGLEFFDSNRIEIVQEFPCLNTGACY